PARSGLAARHPGQGARHPLRGESRRPRRPGLRGPALRDGDGEKGLADEGGRREHAPRGGRAEALPEPPEVKRPKRGKGEPPSPPTVHFYPNDPDAPVGLESVPPAVPDSGEPTFTIEGERYAPAPYAPGTLEFQYWQGEVALARTIRV